MKSLDLDAESWTEDDRSRFYVEGEPVPDLADPEGTVNWDYAQYLERFLRVPHWDSRVTDSILDLQDRMEQERWNAFARGDES